MNIPEEDSLSCSQLPPLPIVLCVVALWAFHLHFNVFIGVVLDLVKLAVSLVRLYGCNFCYHWEAQSHSTLSDPLTLTYFLLPLPVFPDKNLHIPTT